MTYIVYPILLLLTFNTQCKLRLLTVIFIQPKYEEKEKFTLNFLRFARASVVASND
jgi:hypothetical protein